MYEPTQIHPTIFSQKAEILRGVIDGYAEAGMGAEIDLDTAYMVIQVTLAKWVRGKRFVIYVKFDTQSYSYLDARKGVIAAIKEMEEEIRAEQLVAA